MREPKKEVKKHSRGKNPHPPKAKKSRYRTTTKPPGYNNLGLNTVEKNKNEHRPIPNSITTSNLKATKRPKQRKKTGKKLK